MRQETATQEECAAIWVAVTAGVEPQLDRQHHMPIWKQFLSRLHSRDTPGEDAVLMLFSSLRFP